MEKNSKISFYELFYIFLFGCLFGYIVEVIWSFYRFRVFINHTALVIGPFNLVYGISAAVLSIILNKHKNDNLLKLFIISFIAGSVIEYSLSYAMEKMAGFVAWNYKRYMFNINGRICLKYSIFWGILGVIWIKLIYPYVIRLISKIPNKTGEIIKNILIVFLLIDGLLTLQAVDRAHAYEKGIPPSSKYEEYLDEHYGVDYLNNMYNNRWNKK